MSPRQQVAVGMLVSARVNFAVQQAREIPRQEPPSVPEEPPVGDGAYLDGGGDEPAPAERAPASMEEYRARLAQRAAAAGVRSHPGGVDTRTLDQPYDAPQQQGVTVEQVFQIASQVAEQIANSVLSRYGTSQMSSSLPPTSPVPGYGGGYVPPASGPGAVFPGRSPFAPYYPSYRR